MQATGCVEFLRLRQLGYPSGTRGFPSHDCSWFGFVGINYEKSNLIISNFSARMGLLIKVIDF